MARACKLCKNITEENVCPVCKSTELSDDFSGLLVILDPKNSLLAEKLEANEPGNYALKIR
ncbi:MAG: DNA-directed RNA polymerase, subunit E'' [Candidatus Bathyarchaeota archaeon]|nr:DNA-directed RNA polymerase, subunit E'' [Candidatus Bathyarchaeota archaeon]